MTLKTVTELAELEIAELEHAVNSKSDMEDYVSQFAEYTAEHVLHLLKSLVKENKALKAKPRVTVIRRSPYDRVHRTNIG
jgi:hypothetical protein